MKMSSAPVTSECTDTSSPSDVITDYSKFHSIWIVQGELPPTTNTGGHCTTKCDSGDALVEGNLPFLKQEPDSVSDV